MKLVFSSLLIAWVFFLLAIPGQLNAQLNRELQASTVRILCPEPEENAGKGFNIIHLKLSDGTTVGLVSNSSGSGFVINNDGIIVTNNHVVAVEADKEVSSPLVVVMQTVGDRFILHRATVLWQSANADLAVIQTPQLKATPLPIQFDPAKSTPSEEVYSMGFPGIADVAGEDTKRSHEITMEYMNAVLNMRIRKVEAQLHRPLKQAEIDAIKVEVTQKTDSIPGDWMDMMSALDAFLKNADSAAGSWDVTDIIRHKSLWPDYFQPTVTKGNIERFTKVHGFLGANFPDVLMIQHSCAIKHGNSGGPLLNAGGQVIGVVGRGYRKNKKGEVEAVQWATAASELKGWLDSQKVPYTLATEWRKPDAQPIKIIEKQPVIQQLPTQIIQQPTLKIVERLPVKIIVAVSLAVVLAIAVGVVGFLRSNRKPSFTTLLRDPRVARALGTTPSRLLGEDGMKGRPPANEPLSGPDRWLLNGKTSDGVSVSVEMSDRMFASNDYRLIVGRTSDLCHLVINDTSISKQHAHIRKDGSRFLIADRNSSNRTAVNGRFNSSVFEEVPLQEGDTVTFGEVKLSFRKL